MELPLPILPMLENEIDDTELVAQITFANMDGGFA